MKRLLKYLKPFTFPLLMAIALLFLQANAELALPDYMSRIVNIGIQQSGVESPVPPAMRQITMERLAILLTADEQADVLAWYERVDGASPDYDRYLGEYPALADGAIYVLRAADEETLARLEGILARPLVVVFGVEQLTQHPDQAAAMFGSMAAGFDLSRLPPGTDLFTLLT